MPSSAATDLCAIDQREFFPELWTEEDWQSLGPNKESLAEGTRARQTRSFVTDRHIRTVCMRP